MIIICVASDSKFYVEPCAELVIIIIIIGFICHRLIAEHRDYTRHNFIKINKQKKNK